MSHFTTVLEEIETLDPEIDYEQIVQLSSRTDFPSDTAKAMEFALFRTFCVPSIADRLNRYVGTGIAMPERYEASVSIVSEIVAHGCHSERGRAATERLRNIRARHSIPDKDWMYVLSSFICEPIRWIARFGWRPIDEKEQNAWFFLGRAVGQALTLKNLPDSLAEFEQFNREYERDRSRPPQRGVRSTESALHLAPGTMRASVENALRLRGRIATRLVRVPRVVALI